MVLALVGMGAIDILEVPDDPLMLLLAIVVATTLTSVVALSVAFALTAAVPIVLLMYCTQCGRYHLLDLLLDAGPNAMDLHLHAIDGGLAIGQY